MVVVLLCAEASKPDDTHITFTCSRPCSCHFVTQTSARILLLTPCWLSSAKGDFCGDFPAGYEFPPWVLPSLGDSQRV